MGVDVDERKDIPICLLLKHCSRKKWVAVLQGRFRLTHLLLQLRRAGVDNLEETYRGRNAKVDLRLIGYLQEKLLLLNL